MRRWILGVLLLGCASRTETMPADSSASAAEPAPMALADSDLAVQGLRLGADTAAVRRALGPPAEADSISWRYPGLEVWFRDGGVHQVALTSREHTTARGLRVGDRLERLVALYGPSCVSGGYAYCRTVGDEPDERGILVTIDGERVTDIRIGKVFDLD